MLLTKNAVSLGLALAVLAAAPQAEARNDKLLLPAAPVLKQGGTRALIGDFPVRFGAGTAAGYDIVVPQLEGHATVDPYGPASGAGARRQRPDEEVCRDALRKALADMVVKARAAGGTALVGVVSYYDHVEMDSPEVYECHVGRTRAVVDLKAKVARGVPAAQPVLAGASASAAGPAAHAYQIPPASGYAQASEVDKVPLEQKGRERYAHYLTLPSPKAFVVYENGAWRFYAHDGEAMSKALNYCAREGKPCWLYAVDDQVVWQADPAKRIGRADQLQHR